METSINNAAEIELYFAYGYTVFGEIDKYKYSLGERKDYISTIRIKKGNDTVYYERLGNNSVRRDVFDNQIDGFLWWFDRDQPNNKLMKKAVDEALTRYNDFFLYKIRQRQQREKAERR